MSLDLYILKRGHPTKCIHKIDRHNYLLLRPAFACVWRETGIDIDLYTDTRIATGLPELIDSLEEIRNEEGNATIAAELDRLIAALKIALKQRSAVGFFGEVVLSSRSSKEIYATF